MYAKYEITGEIEVVTGLHIGGSALFSAIGAVDSYVVRDGKEDLPMIPGSSLKGKMRSLMAKYYQQGKVFCKIEEEPLLLQRLFGSSKNNQTGVIQRGRLQFCDMFLKDRDKLNMEKLTEIKSENTINRVTGEANPRQIERVVRGNVFELKMYYIVQFDDKDYMDKEEQKIACDRVGQMREVEEDFDAVVEGINLLNNDYLGGHGSRGYGRIKISNLELKEVSSNCQLYQQEDLKELLKKTISNCTQKLKV